MHLFAVLLSALMMIALCFRQRAGAFHLGRTLGKASSSSSSSSTTRRGADWQGAGVGKRVYPRRDGPESGGEAKRSYPRRESPVSRDGNFQESSYSPSVSQDDRSFSPQPPPLIRTRYTQYSSRYNRDFRRNFDDNDYGDDAMPREKPYGDFDGDHLYGISSVRSALLAQKRNMTELLVQEGMDVANKKDEKSASEILDKAKELQIPIREFSKHDLNMMSDNRPHQGFILRAAPMRFKRLDAMEPSKGKFQCILALDEVWDPQNFGALLRTSHFLAVDGVVVCAKNSAPLSPTVSKASSGAMEFMEVFSTDNMMKFIDKSRENGWQVVGAALDSNSIQLRDLPLDKPTILILGNEGHGIRTNILRRCTHLVKISPGGTGVASVVDSLNVSVTGGILLHHILGGKSSS